LVTNTDCIESATVREEVPIRAAATNPNERPPIVSHRFISTSSADYAHLRRTV
jgi:hypothetical protein